MANIIAANRVAGRGLADVVAGSRVVPCNNCKRDLWASPASQRLLAQGDKIYCVDTCAPIKALESRQLTGKRLEFHGVPGWEQEMVETLGPVGEVAVTEVTEWLTQMNESHRES